MWPKEEKLVYEIIQLNKLSLAWDKPKYFPPVHIPTVEHTPWSLQNILIPPGNFDCIVQIIKDKAVELVAILKYTTVIAVTGYGSFPVTYWASKLIILQ